MFGFEFGTNSVSKHKIPRSHLPQTSVCSFISLRRGLVKCFYFTFVGPFSILWCHWLLLFWTFGLLDFAWFTHLHSYLTTYGVTSGAVLSFSTNSTLLNHYVQMENFGCTFLLFHSQLWKFFTWKVCSMTMHFTWYAECLSKVYQIDVTVSWSIMIIRIW